MEIKELPLGHAGFNLEGKRVTPVFPDYTRAENAVMALLQRSTKVTCYQCLTKFEPTHRHERRCWGCRSRQSTAGRWVGS